jgi:hypothetical protein
MRRALDRWILGQVSPKRRRQTMAAKQRGAASESLPRPSEGSHYLTSEGMEWRHTGDAGFWVKPLFEDSASGARTLLMRMDPSAHVGRSQPR